MRVHYKAFGMALGRSALYDHNAYVCPEKCIESTGHKDTRTSQARPFAVRSH